MKRPNTLAVVRLLPEAILAMPVLPHEGHLTSISVLASPSIGKKWRPSSVGQSHGQLLPHI